MTLRLIQVGLGPWGRSWARGVLPHATEVETVAWVDPDRNALESARQLLGTAPDRCDTSLTKTLATVPAEAVLITSSIRSHPAVALAALRAGRHVLVEKPFAPTLAEAAAVVAEARDRGLVLAVAQNYRFFPSMLDLAGRVRAGALGAVERVHVDFRRNQRGLGINPLDDHILTQLSIHHFDLMRAVLDREPRRIFCHTWSPSRDEGIAPSCAAAVIEFAGGPVVSYTASRVSTGPETPWEGEWYLECEGGPLTSTAAVPGEAPPDRLAVLARFVAAVRGAAPPPSPGHDNIRSVALLDAARRSATTGQPVQLPPLDQLIA